MKRRSRFIVAIVVAYLITWVGGWFAHQREMSVLARQLYKSAEASNAKELEWEREGLEEAMPIKLLPNGPKAGMNWCFPLLPGVLVVDCSYVVGPLFGKGTTKIVLFYGFGSITLVELWGWIS